MKKSPLGSRDVIEFSTLKSRCVYLPKELMKMEYKFITDCNEYLNAQLIKRGWRRFGEYFSRPNCDTCTACQSLRIDVQNFTPTRSQKRVLKKNSDTKIVVRKPSVTYDHLILYEKYHRYMQKKKGWDYYSIDADSYNDLYVKGHKNFGNEALYFRDGKLVAVDLIDYLDDGISSIYCYYDPDYQDYSLGVFSLLQEIGFAKQRELRWIYLGYYVQDCDSLNYKIDYKPNQILKNLPDLTQECEWL